MNFEEMQILRKDLAEILVKVAERNWEYQFIADAIAVLDEMLIERSQRIDRLEESYSASANLSSCEQDL